MNDEALLQFPFFVRSVTPDLERQLAALRCNSPFFSGQVHHRRHGLLGVQVAIPLFSQVSYTGGEMSLPDELLQFPFFVRSLTPSGVSTSTSGRCNSFLSGRLHRKA